MRGASGAALVLAVVAGATLAVRGQSGASNGEWPTYGGELANTRYSPLDQITRDNFKNLEVAWRFKTDNLGRRLLNGKQHLVVRISGVGYSAEFVAFKLPGQSGCSQPSVIRSAAS